MEDDLVRIRKNGRSKVLRLSPAIMAALGAKQGDMLVVRVDGQILMARKVTISESLQLRARNGSEEG